MISQGRRRTLLSLVILGHFAVGIISLLPKKSPLQKHSVLTPLFIAYRFLDIEQMWPMFSPPPRTNLSLAYAVQYEKGWTSFIPVSEPAVQTLRTSFFQPRGVFRVATHLRISPLKDIQHFEMSDKDSRAFYYQQLCDYLCQGDGKIADAKRIRLYALDEPMTPFFDEDKAMEKEEEEAKPTTEAGRQLYEQSCETT